MPQKGSVAELILLLQGLPQDAQVLMWNSQGDLAPVEIKVQDNADNGETVSHVELVAEGE